jgi:hypothetical protein
MAKKADNKKLIFLVAMVLGILAIVMYFLPMIVFKTNLIGETKVNFSGFNLVFGAKEVKGITVLGSSSTAYSYEREVKMTVGALVSLICTAVALVAGVLSKMVAKKNQVIVKAVSCLVFIAAAVLVIVLVKSTFESAGNNVFSMDNYSLGIGAYLVCAFNGLAGVAVLLS